MSKVIIEKSAVGDFYGTGIEIWAEFWPIGSTEKKGSGQLLKVFFSCFQGQKKILNFFRNIVLTVLKSYIK